MIEASQFSVPCKCYVAKLFPTCGEDYRGTSFSLSPPAPRLGSPSTAGTHVLLSGSLTKIRPPGPDSTRFILSPLQGRGDSLDVSPKAIVCRA